MPANDLANLIQEMARRARRAADLLLRVPSSAKDAALRGMAASFRTRSADILAANARDVAAAQAAGLSDAMVDRLRLTPPRIEAIAVALEQIAALPDPVGEVTGSRIRPNGLQVARMRAPIGVIGIIYESRPNVTADAGALCLKSGNACILRGGSEALHSNTILAQIMAEACTGAGVPTDAIQFVPTTDRAAVGHLLQADQWVDAIIPRGGKELIERIVRESRIPVIRHLDGNCTVFVDATADLAMATEIIVNAKTQRPGVCNAAETLLVHEAIADRFLPMAGAALQARGVELRGCPRTCRLVPGAVPATEEDWSAEYLALILAVKVVPGIDEAVEFINRYGSHHTESIITNDHRNAQNFLRWVDSACVHVNCSTRFSDGGEYGLGAEIGISTNKLHARGPMGLEELTCQKWIVLGEGQVR